MEGLVVAITLAVSIFIICYFFIILGKVNQALVAMTGGTLLMITHIYSWEEAFRWYINWDTIALLFSMMVIVSITERTGLFHYVAVSFAQAVKGKPVSLLVGSSVLTAIGSALLDNVTTVLLFVPIMLAITKRLHLPAFPYLMMIIFSSNIGGTATLIGDPPNIMIGQAVEHFSFLSFIIHLGPIVVLLLGIVNIFMVVIFKKHLVVDPELVKQLLKQNPAYYLQNKTMLLQSIAVLILTMLGFIFHSALNLDLTTVAVSAAILLLLLTEQQYSINKVFEKVEWETLFFFLGLFVLVGGLEEVGVLDFIAQHLIYLTRGDLISTSIGLLWVSGLISQFINNVPFVAAMIPVIQEFQSFGIDYLDPLWWGLALGACLGGNGTLIGASANVVVAGIAEGEGERISFLQFLKFGLPLVFLSLVLSTIYLVLRYLFPLL
nr:ArsB/NhaD family transporter [Amphibacillus cookii]